MDPDELNRAWWDERARLHGQDGFYYDTEGFLSGTPGAGACPRNGHSGRCYSKVLEG